MFSIVTPWNPISSKKSLSEIEKEMKIDLTRRMEKDEDFGLLKSNGKGNKIINSNKKVSLHLSYVGSVNIKLQFTDVFMVSMKNDENEAILFLIVFSCVIKPTLSNPQGRNDVYLHLRYSSTSLHKDGVEQMMKNIEYIFTKVPKETSMEETVKAVPSL